MKSQFASGVAPKPTRPITEPLPNKPVIHSKSIILNNPSVTWSAVWGSCDLVTHDHHMTWWRTLFKALRVILTNLIKLPLYHVFNQLQSNSIMLLNRLPVNAKNPWSPLVDSPQWGKNDSYYMTQNNNLIRAQWETQMAETSRGRSRSRRPDQINLKEEARVVKIREKSVARESRRARRAASAGRTLTNGYERVKGPT